MKGRCHPCVMAAPVCPTPITACADQAHEGTLCMDPAVGEMQWWVMMGDHQDLDPFVDFTAGVILYEAGWCEFPLLKMFWGCLSVSLSLTSHLGGRRCWAGQEGTGCTPSFTLSPQWGWSCCQSVFLPVKENLLRASSPTAELQKS